MAYLAKTTSGASILCPEMGNGRQSPGRPPAYLGSEKIRFQRIAVKNGRACQLLGSKLK
jgi:hypothetical protein